VPDDRQMIILYLPIEGGKNRYLQAAARNTSAAGSPGMPHKFVVGTDAPSQGLIDTLVTAGGAVPNIMIGGQSLQDMMAQASGAMAQAAGAAAPAAVDPTERLSKLADLHERGVLTDDEFATQKAKILSEM
jgi:membrane protease subunit (stomatin/prohibitin family)